MKSLVSKATSTAAGAIVVLAGCVMAGLGFTVLAVLALFALAALGLAVLASPFVAMAQKTQADADFIMPDEKQAAS